MPFNIKKNIIIINKYIYNALVPTWTITRTRRHETNTHPLIRNKYLFKLEIESCLTDGCANQCVKVLKTVEAFCNSLRDGTAR